MSNNNYKTMYYSLANYSKLTKYTSTVKKRFSKKVEQRKLFCSFGIIMLSLPREIFLFIKGNIARSHMYIL